MALAAATALAGIAFAHFAVALVLVGVGWNFGFIGATTLLAASHRPEERARVQGLNDFLVFGLVCIGSFSSGALMAASGWAAVNLATLPLLAAAAVALGWLAEAAGGRLSGPAGVPASVVGQVLGADAPDIAAAAGPSGRAPASASSASRGR